MRLSYEDVHSFLQQKEEAILSIPFIKQRGDNTCWAACYEMVDTWRGRTRNSCEYINLQTKNCQRCFRPQGNCDKERPVANITRDWRTLGYEATEQYGINLCEDEIRRRIKKKHPIQAFIQFRGKVTGHYILIIGIERRTFTADALIAIIDPARGHITKSFGELFQWGYWQETWVIQ